MITIKCALIWRKSRATVKRKLTCATPAATKKFFLFFFCLIRRCVRTSPPSSGARFYYVQASRTVLSIITTQTNLTKRPKATNLSRFKIVMPAFFILLRTESCSTFGCPRPPSNRPEHLIVWRYLIGDWRHTID